MKTLTKLFSVIVLCLGFSALAQTNTNTVPPNFWDILTRGSNYWVAPFSTYSVVDHSFGGGLAVGYRATEFLHPVARVDYFNDELWVGSLTATLQPPQTWLGKIPIIPFAMAGGAMTFDEPGDEGGGQFTPIVGAGVAIKLNWIGSGSFWQHSDVVVDYELWTDLPPEQQEQVRFGLLWKF